MHKLLVTSAALALTLAACELTLPFDRSLIPADAAEADALSSTEDVGSPLDDVVVPEQDSAPPSTLTRMRPTRKRAIPATPAPRRTDKQTERSRRSAGVTLALELHFDPSRAHRARHPSSWPELDDVVGEAGDGTAAHAEKVRMLAVV